MVTLASNYDSVYNFVGVWMILMPVLGAASFQVYFRLLRDGTNAPDTARPVHWTTVAYLMLSGPLGLACVYFINSSWNGTHLSFPVFLVTLAGASAFAWSAVLAAALWSDTRSLRATLGPLVAAVASAAALFIMATTSMTGDSLPRWQIVPAYIAWHAVCAASLALFARPAWVKRGRAANRLCVRCGYNLRGLRSATCPECGPLNPMLPDTTLP